MNAALLRKYALISLAVLPVFISRAACSSASAGFQTRIEDRIRTELRINQIPGAAVVIVQDGAVMYQKSFGVRDLSSGAPMLPETLVDLASLSKSFTALSILLLQEQGRLDVGGRLQSYLPEFRPVDPRASQITVRHLLRHTSGLTRRMDRTIPCCGSDGDGDLGEAVLRLNDVRLRRLPGSAFEYANSNYILLAALVERLSSLEFHEFLAREVFPRFSMTTATVSLETARRRGISSLHEWQWGRMRNSPSQFYGWLGASSVKASLLDLSAYLEQLLGRKPGPFQKLLLEQVCKAESPVAYDWGWEIVQASNFFTEQCTLRHDGIIWGANSAAILVPRLRTGVAVLLNAGVGRAQPLAEAILMETLGIQPPEPQPPAWVAVPDNWAMVLVAGAMILLTATLIYVRRACRQLRTGRRRFRPPGILTLTRGLLFFSMAGYLLHLTAGGSAPPRESLPATIQVAFPLLSTCLGLLFLAIGVLNFSRLENSPD